METIVSTVRRNPLRFAIGGVVLVIVIALLASGNGVGIVALVGVGVLAAGVYLFIRRNRSKREAMAAADVAKVANTAGFHNKIMALRSNVAGEYNALLRFTNDKNREVLRAHRAHLAGQIASDEFAARVKSLKESVRNEETKFTSMVRNEIKKQHGTDDDYYTWRVFEGHLYPDGLRTTKVAAFFKKRGTDMFKKVIKSVGNGSQQQPDTEFTMEDGSSFNRSGGEVV